MENRELYRLQRRYWQQKSVKTKREPDNDIMMSLTMYNQMHRRANNCQHQTRYSYCLHICQTEMTGREDIARHIIAVC